jgi:Protein of unknown function (DUF3551)
MIRNCAGRLQSIRAKAPRFQKEAPMRIPALAILTIAAVLTATPAPAQTYDPKYPVCLQVYQGFTDYYFECAYTSLAQCNMSASGRAASCVVNPYYAGAKGRRDRRPRRDY